MSKGKRDKQIAEKSPETSSIPNFVYEKRIPYFFKLDLE